MPKATVKLTETIETIGGNKVVRKMGIAIEMTGKGTTLLTSTEVNGSIEFYSQEKPKAQPVKIATLETLKVSVIEETGAKGKKKQVAKFDMTSASMTSEIKSDESDFGVMLVFDPKNFINPDDIPLRLPWKPPLFTLTPKLVSGNYRIGARFLVNGNEESKAFGDIGDVLTKHTKVKTDPDIVLSGEKPLEFDAIGATIAYPIVLSSQNRLFPPPANRKIAIGSNPLRILLHPDVKSQLNTLKSNSFDLALLTSNIQTIFAPVFSNVTVEDIPAGDVRLNAWKYHSRELYSATVVDPANPQVDEGHLVSFFDFWIFASKNSGSNELAKAEDLASPPHWFDTPSQQKRIQQPATIPTESGSSFSTAYRGLQSKDQQMILAAIVIAHETGHGLGLSHSRTVDANYPTASSIGLMGNPPTLNGAYTLAKLGEVHTAVLNKHYR